MVGSTAGWADGRVDGRVGFFDPDGADDDGCVTVAEVHSRPVTALIFDPRDSHKLYSSSYDNTVCVCVYLYVCVCVCLRNPSFTRAPASTRCPRLCPPCSCLRRRVGNESCKLHRSSLAATCDSCCPLGRCSVSRVSLWWHHQGVLGSGGQGVTRVS